MFTIYHKPFSFNLLFFNLIYMCFIVTFLQIISQQYQENQQNVQF